MSTDLGPALDASILELEAASNEFKRVATEISRHIEAFERTLSRIGALNEGVWWFMYEDPDDPFPSTNCIGFKIAGDLCDDFLYVAYGNLKSGAKKTEVVGDWRPLSAADIGTKSIAIPFLPRLAEKLKNQVEERTKALSTRLNALYELNSPKKAPKEGK